MQTITGVALAAAALEQNTVVHPAAPPVQSCLCYARASVTVVWKLATEGAVFTRRVWKPAVSWRDALALFLPPTAWYYHIHRSEEYPNTQSSEKRYKHHLHLAANINRNEEVHFLCKQRLQSEPPSWLKSKGNAAADCMRLWKDTAGINKGMQISLGIQPSFIRWLESDNPPS